MNGALRQELSPGVSGGQWAQGWRRPSGKTCRGGTERLGRNSGPRGGKRRTEESQGRTWEQEGLRREWGQLLVRKPARERAPKQ